MYEGKYRDGNKFKGIYKFKNGAIYDGRITNNQKNGLGRMVLTNEEYYGDWKDDF